MSNFIDLKSEIKEKAKCGVDFILSAGIIWIGIYLIWAFLSNTAYEKSIFTFIIGSLLLPLALGLSKVFKTNWKIKDNPLQPLGLWLNFAQLIYFPFLVFVLIKCPDYFIMAYAIITGAHLFPYAWYYDEVGYSISAILISVGSLMIALIFKPDKIFIIPLFTAVFLLLLGIWIIIKHSKFWKNSVVSK